MDNYKIHKNNNIILSLRFLPLPFFIIVNKNTGTAKDDHDEVNKEHGDK